MSYDVTIGIPLYNCKDYVVKALESALSQSYSSIEFLIIDDNSEDDSGAIICNYQKKHRRGNDIRLLTHNENLGVSASRNQIVDEAKGDYLFFMDSDDYIAPNTIELLFDNIRQYKAEIAFGSYEKVGINGERSVYQYPRIQLLGKDLLANFAYRKYAGIQASACNFLVELSLLRGSGLRFININYWEDFAFTFDLVTIIERAVLLPDITYIYKCRENSLSNYYQRDIIYKEEIMQNVFVVDHLKNTSSNLKDKDYYPDRCYNIVMTDFYIACTILKRRTDIVPYISNKEIMATMRHPASLWQICHFKRSRLKNFLLYFIGNISCFLCVFIIWITGKHKKLI